MPPGYKSPTSGRRHSTRGAAALDCGDLSPLWGRRALRSSESEGGEACRRLFQLLPALNCTMLQTNSERHKKRKVSPRGFEPPTHKLLESPAPPFELRRQKRKLNITSKATAQPRSTKIEPALAAKGARQPAAARRVAQGRVQSRANSHGIAVWLPDHRQG